MMSSFDFQSSTNEANAYEIMSTPIAMTLDESPRCIGAVNKFNADRDIHESTKFNLLGNNKKEDEETPAEVAALLASISTIASREIKDDSSMMKELAEIAFPDLSRTDTADEVQEADGYVMPPEDLMQWQYCHGPSVMPSIGIKHRHRHYRGEEKKKRAVSIDNRDHSVEESSMPTLLQWRSVDNSINNTSNSYNDPYNEQVEGGIFSTPPHSPAGKHHSITFGTAPNSEYRRSNHHNHEPPFKKTSMSIAENVKTKYARPRSVSLAEYKGNGYVRQKKEARRRHASVGNAPDLHWNSHLKNEDDKPVQMISRKKFSWKNYPELEEFLVANREEYLRHSTLNYTMQQKKYNNTLTQRLIELAATHGYQFDPQDFSFVTVRDRIRCYFKSYVQSMKKRGVVIGYAARKAGLVTEEELEASAMTSGKIYVPCHEMEWESDDA